MNSMFFNPEIKNRFLNSLEDSGTRRTYKSILMKCTEAERFHNKDVCNFNQEEYVDLLFNFNARSLASIATHNSTISSYIEYAIDSGFADPNRLVDNVAQMFSRQELLQFVRADAMERQYLNSEELDDFVNFCYNAQDAALIQVVREGVRGSSGDELIGLRIQDIDIQQGILHLRGKSGERELKVGGDTVDLLVQAHNQRQYWKRNGESTNKKSGFVYLPEVDYVFKPTGQKRLEPVNYQILRRRLSTLAEWHNNPFLTVTNIWKSGMIEYGRKIKRENNLKELSVRHYEMISEKYGRSIDSAYWLKCDIGLFIDG